MTQPHRQTERPTAQARGNLMPPHDLDAEGIVLGHLFEHPEQLERVAFLKPEHFYAQANTLVYRAMLDLSELGTEVDVVAVATRLRSQSELERIGGTPYLHKLAFEQPACVRPEQHAMVVFERWRLRQVIAYSQQATAVGFQTPEDVQAFIEQHENAIAELAYQNRRRGLELAADILAKQLEIIQEAHERGGSASGTATGFKDLDNLTGGWYGGDLTILAARPGMGKTTLALTLINHVARPREEPEDQDAAALFSLEMPSDQLVVRIACARADVPYTAVRRNVLTKEHIQRLLEALDYLKRVPLWIDDTPSLSIAELRARVRKLRREVEQGTSKVPAKRLGLVAIDYLQLMTGIRQRGDSREQEVSSISQALKNLAKQEAVPVLALSQLNRGVEAKSGRKDKRPQLHDLRESGAIEQDADNIWFVYREGYYDDAKDKNDTELIVAKQRSGPIGSMFLVMDAARARFRAKVKDGDVDPDQYDGDYEDR